MIILGIESTCDETAAALVEDGRHLLSNVISTSVKEQALYGGVVPEIASGYLTNALYLLETNVRHSAILGYVGAGGIGAPLIFAMSSYRWNEVGAILLGLIVLVLIIEWISARIRVKLARG